MASVGVVFPLLCNNAENVNLVRKDSLEADIHTGGGRHVTGVAVHWESSSV